MTGTSPISDAELNRLVKLALQEDLGKGDLTAPILQGLRPARAIFLARQAGVLSGIHVARAVYKQLDPGVRFYVTCEDGEAFKENDILGEVIAPLPVLLSGERVALNFLQQLSGVATITAAYVAAAGKSAKAGIYDTRKTTPGLRLLEKAAVVHGGGRNHRLRLDDMAMLKNNHIDALGGISKAVAALHTTGFFTRKRPLPWCIEVRNLKEAETAARQDPMPTIIMFDNMSPDQILECAAAVRAIAAKRKVAAPALEVSGGITLKTVAKYARLPIDRVSVGALTHSAPAVDISLRIQK